MPALLNRFSRRAQSLYHIGNQRARHLSLFYAVKKNRTKTKNEPESKTPPDNLTAAQKVIFAEFLPYLEDSTPPQIVETIAATLGRIREARAILARESLVIVSHNGQKISHPALKIEVLATKTLDLLMGNWARTHYEPENRNVSQ